MLVAETRHGRARGRRKFHGRVFVKMRLKIPAAAAALLAAAALFAACDPQDGSAPAANNARQTATPASAANTTAGPVAPATPAAQSSPAATTPSDGIRRITIAESRAMAERGEAVIYDVRDRHTYQNNHVKGAKSVPLDEVAARVAEFPKDKLVITYCA